MAWAAAWAGVEDVAAEGACRGGLTRVAVDARDHLYPNVGGLGPVTGTIGRGTCPGERTELDVGTEQSAGVQGRHAVVPVAIRRGADVGSAPTASTIFVRWNRLSTFSGAPGRGRLLACRDVCGAAPGDPALRQGCGRITQLRPRFRPENGLPALSFSV